MNPQYDTAWRKHFSICIHRFCFKGLTLLPSEWPKLYGVMAILSVIGLNWDELKVLGQWQMKYGYLSLLHGFVVSEWCDVKLFCKMSVVGMYNSCPH